MSSKQDNAISYVRLVAMAMIVLCHFFQFYSCELAYWFNVGVQIFFVISGFLYGSKDIDSPIDFICRQFKKILIPYYVFLTVAFVLYAIFARASLSLDAVARAVFCVGTVDGLGHLWFIGYILACYLLTPYLYWLRKKIEGYSLLGMTLIYIAVCLMLVVLGTLTNSYFRPDRICCYIVGFAISSWSNRCGKGVFKWLLVAFGSLAIILNGVRIYLKYFHTLSGAGLLVKLFTFIEPYCHLLLGVALFLGLYLAFSRLGACILNTLSDKYSFYVYIVHLLFILSPFSTMSLFDFAPLNVLITVVLILGGAIILHLTSNFILTLFSTKTVLGDKK